MMSPGFKAFSAALDSAGRSYLATREVTPTEGFRLHVEECPVHGAGCARVTYGMFRQHVPWARADTAELAAALLGTMLPAPGHDRPTAVEENSLPEARFQRADAETSSALP